MSQDAHYVLPILAIVFAVVGIAKPTYPLAAIAVILLAVNAFIK